jgi:glutaminase
VATGDRPAHVSTGTLPPTELVDTAGNSVKGQLAARHLSRQLGLDLFRSAPLVG